MKSRLVLVLGVFAFSLMAAGCKNRSTPKNVMGMAANAIKKSDFKTFRSTLDRDALTKYGTPEAMEILRAELAQFTDHKLGRANLIRRERGYQGHGRYGDLLRVYQSQIFGKDAEGVSKAIFVGEVTCQVDLDVMPGGQSCNYVPNAGVVCRPNPDTYAERQFCLITDFRDL